MKTLLLALLLLTATSSRGADGERKLTLEFTREHSDKSFAAGESISFSVVLHTLNVEDRNRFEDLVIDDWRYDTPNYFTDHRSPNVVLHVERFERARWESVAFRASSQGGGGSLEKAIAEVEIFVGGDEGLQQEELQRLLERAKKDTSAPDVKKQLHDLRAIYGPNKLGRYRITATYTGLLKGNGRVLVTSGPVEVTVK